MSIEIAVASAHDSEEWTRLRFALWPDCPRQRHRLEIEQLLQGDGVVAIAWEGNRAIGMVELSIRNDHVEGTSVAPVPYLEGWFVEKDRRGIGVGRALLKFAEDWSRNRGFPEIASDAEFKNDQSIRLHGELGFREVGRSVHFVKRLKP